MYYDWFSVLIETGCYLNQRVLFEPAHVNFNQGVLIEPEWLQEPARVKSVCLACAIVVPRYKKKKK